MSQVPDKDITDSASKTTSRLGFWSAVLTAITATVSLAIAIATPPVSGPYCLNECVLYPYANVAQFVPHDYIWMVPGFLLAPIFVVLMVCIHHNAPNDKKIFSQLGLSFALIYATVISIDYYIQLTVMQPSLLKGEAQGLTLFLQYNPHGIFIALEDLGYLMMSVAFLFAAATFAGGERLERVIRWLFIVNFLAAIGTFIVLSLLYGYDLEYRFEVLIITINWTTLIVGGVLLSAFFRRVTRHRAP
jgi:hypothetical protein